MQYNGEDLKRDKYVKFHGLIYRKAIFTQILCTQVGPGEGYELTVKGFRSSASSLYNGMKHNDGMKFTTR